LLDSEYADRKEMTAEHFKEYFYTIMLTTHSEKREMCQYLNISKVTLNKYLRFGLPDARGFMIVDKLEEYLIANLGGYENESNIISSHSTIG
jgi:hypothetical protein